MCEVQGRPARGGDPSGRCLLQVRPGRGKETLASGLAQQLGVPPFLWLYFLHLEVLNHFAFDSNIGLGDWYWWGRDWFLVPFSQHLPMDQVAGRYVTALWGELAVRVSEV